jgi:hypothetical protein
LSSSSCDTGFHEQSLESRRSRLFSHRVVVLRGESDQPRPTRAGVPCQLPRHGDAAVIGKIEVKEDDLRPELLGDCHCPFCRPDGANLPRIYAQKA